MYSGACSGRKGSAPNFPRNAPPPPLKKNLKKKKKKGEQKEKYIGKHGEKIGKNVTHFPENIYPCLELDEAASPGGKAEQGHQALGHNLEVVYYVCCLLCEHCSNWTWVIEEVLAYCNRLRSTH